MYDIKNIFDKNGKIYAGRIVVDNNDAGEDVFSKVYKQVMHLAKSKVQNSIGQQWIAGELAKKRR